MKALPEKVIQFLHSQGFVIVSTLDKDGFVHNSCKGVVDIAAAGKIYLLDVYKAQTYLNLKRNPKISLTAVDEHKFTGYSLKGAAKIIAGENIKPQLVRAWEDRISSRLTRRLLKNIREDKAQGGHPEALLPKPQYLIEVDIKDIIDLTPHHLRQED